MPKLGDTWFEQEPPADEHDVGQGPDTSVDILPPVDDDMHPSLPAPPSVQAHEIDPVIDAWRALDEKIGTWEPLTQISKANDAILPKYWAEVADAGQAKKALPPTLQIPPPPLQAVLATLEEIIGRDAVGSKIAITADQTRVGRSPNNHVVCKHESVSREHAHILHDAKDGFFVKDLKSGNGTYINGHRIDIAALKHGDEIAFGDVRWRFLLANPPDKEISQVIKVSKKIATSIISVAQKPAVYQGIKRISGMMRVLVFTGMCCLVVGFIFWRVNTARLDRHNKHIKTMQYFQRGIDAFKAHRFQDAAVIFHALQQQNPKHPDVVRYVQATSVEMQAQAQLAEAHMYRKQGDLLKASTIAHQLLLSIFHDEAQSILQEVDADIELRIGNATRALEKNDTSQALRILQDILLLEPHRPDVLALMARAKVRHMPNGKQRS